MDTPQKRIFAEVDPDSSPEIQEPKRLSGMSGMEAIIADIQAKLSAVAELKELGQSTNQTVTQISESLGHITRRLTANESTIDQLIKENTHLKSRVTLLEEKAIRQEAYDRRDNLIIEGIPIQANEDIEAKVREIIRVNLKCPNADEMKFTRVHRLSNSRRTIVRFHYFKDRETVWGNRRLLKGTNYWPEEDFPSEWRNRRQVLYPILKAARKIKDVKARLSQDKLIINSQTYSVDNLSSLPPSINLDSLVQIHDGNVLFASKSSPLSNFYPAPFSEKGINNLFLKLPGICYH